MNIKNNNYFQNFIMDPKNGYPFFLGGCVPFYNNNFVPGYNYNINNFIGANIPNNCNYNNNFINYGQNYNNNINNINCNYNQNYYYFNNNIICSQHQPNEKKNSFNITNINQLKVQGDPSKQKMNKMEFATFFKGSEGVEKIFFSLDGMNPRNLEILLANILEHYEIFLANFDTWKIIDKLIDKYNSSPCSINKESSVKNDNIENKETTDNNIIINTSKNTINTKLFNFLMSYFSKRIISLIFVKNYVNILQKLICKLKSPCNDFIYQEMCEDFLKLGKSRSGCFMIQIAFIFGTDEQQEKLLGFILSNCFSLINDSYGHYLYKFLLDKEKNGEKYYPKLFSILIDYIPDLTNKKLASTVIEKFLDSNDNKLRTLVIEKLAGNEKDIIELIFNQYGNYILQKIITINEPKYNIKLIEEIINKNKKKISHLSYGKRLIGLLHRKTINNNSNSNTNSNTNSNSDSNRNSYTAPLDINYKDNINDKDDVNVINDKDIDKKYDKDDRSDKNKQK